MIAATSAIVKEEHQADTCIYCGAKLKDDWKYVFLDGLEYKMTQCENGHEARIRVSGHLVIEQIVGVHRLDWGKERRI